MKLMGKETAALTFFFHTSNLEERKHLLPPHPPSPPMCFISVPLVSLNDFFV